MTTTQPGTPAGFVARGGWWVVGQFTLMLGVAGCGWWWPGSWGWVWTRIGSWLVLGLAAIVAVLGARQLRRALRPFPKPGAGDELVTGGVYGWVRHPLYLSLLLAGVGWALLRGSVAALVAVVVLAGFLDAKARREEVWLREHYPGYEAYARAVRRFLPWIY